MVNKKPNYFIKPRELLAVALTDKAQQFKLTFSEGDYTLEIIFESLVSIEPEIILAINLDGYIPKTKKAEIIISNDKGEKMGFLKMTLVNTLTLESNKLCLYRVSSAYSNLLPFYSIIPDILAFAFKKKFAFRFKEIVRLRKLFVYYLKPKPSFFLSTKSKDNFDIFPIDLTGKIAGDYFSIAIKNTNKAIELIKASQKLCLSALPFNKTDVVYAHSKQRKKGTMNATTLQFNISESKTLKIPVPNFALNVNELQLEQFFEQGAYTVFIVKSINHYILSDGLQMAHTPWYNKHFLSGTQSSAIH